MSDISQFEYQNPELPIEERVDDLVGRMTLEEKVSQMLHTAPAIERLSIPEYDWWNECLHGVGRAGLATVFPQAIGMAASFDTELLGRVGQAISDEARAKHHQAAAKGYRGRYFGLTYWTPNINIFRDPRWGRGHETYGEDPYLTARMGVEFCKSLQGDDPRYLKLVATPKHYAVHSGPESLRHSFDARVSLRDLHETYLPAFKACVQQGKAYSVMGAYNRVNGEPCCASKTLLQDILRDQWGFEGYVASDCWAICDLHENHKVTDTPPESAALAVKNGCDLNCGKVYSNLLLAVEQGLMTEQEIDTAVKRLFMARFRLGMFDPPERVPYSRISPDVVHCDAHVRLARRIAQESMVLLKNENQFLPVDRDKVKSIAVIGPNAMSQQALLANYHGFSPTLTTIMQGILAAVSPGTQVTHACGCDITGSSPLHTTLMECALQDTDLIVAVLGLSAELEGEEADEGAPDGGGDKKDISLPGRQQELLEYLHKTGKPVMLVFLGGSSVDLCWAQENIPAILCGWYPGQEGGHAVADVIFGDYNPAGRLPVTFYKSEEQLPPFVDYDMKGRTYRYMTEVPLYPFGYGLSYSSFEYSNLQLSAESIKPDQSLAVTVDVTNAGNVAGDEVVQLYTDTRGIVPDGPRQQLRGFQRIHLKPNETKAVELRLSPEDLNVVTPIGQELIIPGTIRIIISNQAPVRCPHLSARIISCEAEIAIEK